MQPVVHSGKLTKWKDNRGFGFIQPVDGSQEVFFHISELKDGTRRPRKDDIIYYHCAVDSDGKVRACDAFIRGTDHMSTFLSDRADSSNTIVPNFPMVNVVLLSFLPLIGSIHFTWTMRNPLPLILYPTMSVMTYFLYEDDKNRAMNNDLRTPEKTLHIFEFAGGWIGGFVAQHTLRHKSQKHSYQLSFWTIVIVHYIAWLFWLL